MLCRSVGMYFPLKINQMFKPNYKTKFITFIGTDEDVEHPEWGRTAWVCRSETLGVKPEIGLILTIVTCMSTSV